MISIKNLTRKREPKISWEKIQEKVLGKKYDLSLVLAPDVLMKKLNAEYRKSKKAASVLSFLFSKKEGEIFINMNQKKHPIAQLFIHALLHLKKFEHGVRMEEQEQILIRKYGKGNNHRNRYRHINYKSSCRRK